VIVTTTNTVTATIGVGFYPTGIAVQRFQTAYATFAYVTNEGDNTVSVINLDTNAVTATIGVGAHPRGVAVNHDGTLVYVTNSGDNTVSVINAYDLTPRRPVPGRGAGRA
jgi:YVTN family beta-propeller protein